MEFHVFFEDFCNSIWFRYLFDSSTMSSMILLVRNNLKYDKVLWPWGVFLAGAVTSLNGKCSLRLWNILSRGTQLTKELFYANFLSFCYYKADFRHRLPSHRLCYRYFMNTCDFVNTPGNISQSLQHQNIYLPLIQLYYQARWHDCKHHWLLNWEHSHLQVWVKFSVKSCIPFFSWTFKVFVCIFWIVFLKKTWYYCSSSTLFQQ